MPPPASRVNEIDMRQESMANTPVVTFQVMTAAASAPPNTSKPAYSLDLFLILAYPSPNSGSGNSKIMFCCQALIKEKKKRIRICVSSQLETWGQVNPHAVLDLSEDDTTIRRALKIHRNLVTRYQRPDPQCTCNVLFYIDIHLPAEKKRSTVAARRIACDKFMAWSLSRDATALELSPNPEPPYAGLSTSHIFRNLRTMNPVALCEHMIRRYKFWKPPMPFMAHDVKNDIEKGVRRLERSLVSCKLDQLKDDK
ncbi:hypothetical protein B0J14DRAFT_568746 [Halenospora varia]|nr:hypothetical protein B0J14DRAFT_568746 [Halenospora varia]